MLLTGSVYQSYTSFTQSFLSELVIENTTAGAGLEFVVGSAFLDEVYTGIHDISYN